MSTNRYETILKVAEESIKRVGFVVVSYHKDHEPQIGQIQHFLWREFKMPQPFVAIRRATKEEWLRQIEIAASVTGRIPTPEQGAGFPWILMTD